MLNSLTEKCLKFMMKSVMETGKIMCDKDHEQSIYREVFLETGYLNPSSKYKGLCVRVSVVGTV